MARGGGTGSRTNKKKKTDVSDNKSISNKNLEFKVRKPGGTTERNLRDGREAFEGPPG